MLGNPIWSFLVWHTCAAICWFTATQPFGSLVMHTFHTAAITPFLLVHLVWSQQAIDGDGHLEIFSQLIQTSLLPFLSSCLVLMIPCHKGFKFLLRNVDIPYDDSLWYRFVMVLSYGLRYGVIYGLIIINDVLNLRLVRDSLFISWF